MITLLKILKKLRVSLYLQLALVDHFVGNNLESLDFYLKYLNDLDRDDGKSSYRVNQLQPPKYDIQIIVPAFNCKNTIRECLSSILNQRTSASYLLTVIDDGSTDGTSEIIDNQKKVHPQINIIHQRNKGFSGARNAGLNVISGKYIMFIDSDDTLRPYALEKLFQVAQDSNEDIIEGGYNYINKDGKVLSIFKHKNEKNVDPYKKLYGYPWGKLYKSELFANTIFPEGYWFEDTMAMYRIWNKAEKVSTVNDIIYNYLDNDKGITHTSIGNPKVIDTIWITERLLKDYFKYGDPNSKSEQQIYNFTLRQIHMNANRVVSLKNRKVNKANFVISCHMLKRYFRHMKTEQKKYHLLEKSLKTKNYPLFLVSVFGIQLS